MVRVGSPVGATTEAEGDILAPSVALALPALAWLIVAVVVLLAALLGYRPLGAPADLTLSEAAALRDGAEVLRQLAQGADPNRSYRVRHGFRRSTEYVMTPLEAAVANDLLGMVRLLVDRGALPDANTRPALGCFAQRLRRDEIVTFLTQRGLIDPLAECDDDVRTLW